MMYPDKTDCLIGQWHTYVDNIINYARTHKNKFVLNLINSLNDSFGSEGKQNLYMII